MIPKTKISLIKKKGHLQPDQPVLRLHVHVFERLDGRQLRNSHKHLLAVAVPQPGHLFADLADHLQLHVQLSVDRAQLRAQHQRVCGQPAAVSERWPLLRPSGQLPLSMFARLHWPELSTTGININCLLQYININNSLLYLSMNLCVIHQICVIYGITWLYQ